MLANLRSDLLGRDEEVGGAVGVDDRVSERDRRVSNVGAADVEGPGDGIERGEDRRVGVMLTRASPRISVRFSAADLPAYSSD